MQDITKDGGNKLRINPPSETYGISSFFSLVFSCQVFYFQLFCIMKYFKTEVRETNTHVPTTQTQWMLTCQMCCKYFFCLIKWCKYSWSPFAPHLSVLIFRYEVYALEPSLLIILKNCLHYSWTFTLAYEFESQISLYETCRLCLQEMKWGFLFKIHWIYRLIWRQLTFL